MVFAQVTITIFTKMSKIHAHEEDATCSVKNIEVLAPQFAAFVELDAISKDTFIRIAHRLEKAKDETLEIHKKLLKPKRRIIVKKIYRFVAAPEILAEIKSLCNKLEEIERDLEQKISEARRNVMFSAIIEKLSNNVFCLRLHKQHSERRV